MQQIAPLALSRIYSISRFQGAHREFSPFVGPLRNAADSSKGDRIGDIVAFQTGNHGVTKPGLDSFMHMTVNLPPNQLSQRI
jgi:hypothetical protein